LIIDNNQLSINEPKTQPLAQNGQELQIKQIKTAEKCQHKMYRQNSFPADRKSGRNANNSPSGLWAKAPISNALVMR